MAYDAINLSVLCGEFQTLLVGGKITKIYQPEKDEIVLFVFNKQTHKLIISANATVNRIHVTQMPTDNPKIAPSFCMLLRKHVTNATILSVTQMPFERVLDFELVGSDELGYKTQMHLIFELTGKTSNIILTDGSYIIMDSIKHLPQDLDSKRLILAGAKYEFFPPQNKIAPFDLPRVREFLSACNTPIRQALAENLLGVSNATVNEITFGIDDNDHTAINVDKIIQRLTHYEKNLHSPAPCVIMQRGTPVDVCPFPYQSVKGEELRFDTLDAAHDNYYYMLDKAQRFNDKAKSVSTVVKNAVSRTEKKLAAQRQSMLEAENRETYKQYGDLILSNLWKIQTNCDTLTCENYFDGNAAVTIPLNKMLSPQQNAQAYYKKYRKAKSASEHNAKLVEENTKLLEYLQTVRENLRYCTEPDDLEQIRSELIAVGLVKENRNGKKTPKEQPVQPLCYDVYGYAVFVGKNNVQNNFVTFKLAKPTDVWLHTQKIHSSHVVISNPNGAEISENVLLAAAEICAFFSQGNGGDKIPVDFTLRQNVKKPSHAPLGFVTYTTYQTVLVTPNRHTEWLRNQ